MEKCIRTVLLISDTNLKELLLMGLILQRLTSGFRQSAATRTNTRLRLLRNNKIDPATGNNYV